MSNLHLFPGATTKRGARTSRANCCDVTARPRNTPAHTQLLRSAKRYRPVRDPYRPGPADGRSTAAVPRQPGQSDEHDPEDLPSGTTPTRSPQQGDHPGEKEEPTDVAQPDRREDRGWVLRPVKYRGVRVAHSTQGPAAKEMRQYVRCPSVRRGPPKRAAREGERRGRGCRRRKTMTPWVRRRVRTRDAAVRNRPGRVERLRCVSLRRSAKKRHRAEEDRGCNDPASHANQTRLGLVKPALPGRGVAVPWETLGRHLHHNRNTCTSERGQGRARRFMRGGDSTTRVGRRHVGPVSHLPWWLSHHPAAIPSTGLTLDAGR